jgi:hypothetical protein
VYLFLLLALSPQDYDADIFPIFEKHCFACHNSGTKMGSLDLETFDGLLRGGNHGTILVHSKPAESRLYTMLTGEHAPAMPMDGKLLPAAEIAKIREWIEQGAKPPVERHYSVAWRAVKGRGEETATGNLRTVTLWAADGKTKIATFAGHSGAVRALAFSPDGKRLASGDERGNLRVWDLDTASLDRQFPGLSGPVTGLSYSADGRFLAAIANGKFKAWQIDGAREVLSQDSVSSYAFAPDGKRIAVTRADGSLSVHLLRD